MMAPIEEPEMFQPNTANYDELQNEKRQLHRARTEDEQPLGWIFETNKRSICIGNCLVRLDQVTMVSQCISEYSTFPGELAFIFSAEFCLKSRVFSEYSESIQGIL